MAGISGGSSEESASGLASGAAVGASNLVGSRFLQSQEYASSAWAKAQSGLAALNDLIMHPAIDSEIDIPFNYTSNTINVPVLGEKPDTPSIDSTFDFIKPVLNPLKEIPAFSYLTDSIDDLRVQFIDRISEILEAGSTGLSPEAEQMLWDRARGRQETENIRMYVEAEEYFSSRGYVLPPGALAGRLQEIAIEIGRNNANLNNDITVEQAKLAQTNFQFVLERGAVSVLEMMKTSIASVIDYNKGTIDVFMAEVERYKQEIQTKLATIEGITKIYMAEAEVYKTNADVNIADIEAQVKINGLKLEEAKTQVEIDIKKAELELDAATKVFTLQVEAMKANTQVLAQIAASALSGVNATASYGFSGGASLSESDGYSHSWSEQYSESNDTTRTLSA